MKLIAHSKQYIPSLVAPIEVDLQYAHNFYKKASIMNVPMRKVDNTYRAQVKGDFRVS